MLGFGGDAMKVIRSMFECFVIAITCDYAHAQSAPPSSPLGLTLPALSSTDSNGVDVASGRFLNSLKGPSIGPSDIGLSLDYDAVLDRTTSFLRGELQDMSTGAPGTVPADYLVQVGPQTTQIKVYTDGSVYIEAGSGGESLNASTHTFTDRYGIVSVFNENEKEFVPNNAYISKKTFPNGEVLTFTYIRKPSNGLPILTSVFSSSGYGAHLDYNADYSEKDTVLFNRSVDYCSPSAVSCAFSRNWPRVDFSPYGSTGSVWSINGIKTIVENYSFQSRKLTLPADVAAGTGPTVTLAYGQSSYCSPYYYGNANSGRVISFTTKAGSWNYTYKQPCVAVGIPPSKSLDTIRTDPLGHTTEFHSYAGRVQYKRDELSRITQYSIDYLGRINESTSAEGMSNTLNRDARGNVTSLKQMEKPNYGSLIFTSSATYPSTCTNHQTCNLPTSVTDNNGNTTYYTYYDWGGLKSASGPENNGVRPLKLYYYTQLYAYVKNETGSLVAEKSPIWRLFKTTECRDSSSSDSISCASGTGEIITNYEYGTPGSVNALLVHGQVDNASSGALRTCYQYDVEGNLISKTSPRAGLASCS